MSPESIGCPELKNIGHTLWVIQKTSFWFSRHVYHGGQALHADITRRPLAPLLVCEPWVGCNPLAHVLPSLTQTSGSGCQEAYRVSHKYAHGDA